MLVNKPTVFLKGFTQTVKDGFLSKLGWRGEGTLRMERRL